MEKLIISPAPHIHGGDTIAKNMTGVIIALIPALLVGFYFFGLGALIVTLTSVAALCLLNILFKIYTERSLQSRWFAALTGLLWL
jgi:electron transport complex protein RnfD